jgi:hypothetical protein
MVVGRQVADTLRAELALDALKMAIWFRDNSAERVRGKLLHAASRAGGLKVFGK